MAVQLMNCVFIATPNPALHSATQRAKHVYDFFLKLRDCVHT